MLENDKVNDNFAILDNSHLELFLIEIWLDIWIDALKYDMF